MYNVPIVYIFCASNMNMLVKNPYFRIKRFFAAISISNLKMNE